MDVLRALCLLVCGLVAVLDAASVSNRGYIASYNRTSRSSSFKALPKTLRICAFNIKTFGVAKMSDPTRARIIRDIVLRYDVILIQEIRDATGTALNDLWDLVDRSVYGLVYSDRLGRSSYKEQYAFFYRLDRLQLVDVHQYDDGPDDYSDMFEREPFSARFRLTGARCKMKLSYMDKLPFLHGQKLENIALVWRFLAHKLKGTWDLALTGLHAKPADAVKEIKALLDVYDDVMGKWSDLQDVIILGDLNAACNYAKVEDLSGLVIYDQQMFLWPLGFDADTTTSNTKCAYDRFIVTGPNVRQSFIPGSEGIYNFENTHRLSYDEMLDISDHYPIELELY